MNNTRLEIKSLLLSNLSNPKLNLTKTQIEWITRVITNTTNVIDDVHTRIQCYPEQKIEVYEIPELVRIYSKTICHESNQLQMFDLDNIIKTISFLMDVLIYNRILIVNGSISNENISKLVINCTSLLNISILENMPPKTMSDSFSHMYMDFIKVLTEPLGN